MAPRLIPVDTLHGLPPEAFAAALQPLFEAAEPLLRVLYAERPFVSYTQLLERAEQRAQALPESEQIQVLNAHPRIGEHPERMSSLSRREQGYDREAAPAPDDVDAVNARLAELNAAYEARFGFRFVVFVDGRPRAAIVDLLEQRLNQPRADELRTGLSQLFSIARARLRLLANDT